MAQQTTTKIQFESDFKVSGLLAKLAVEDKILAACDVLKKNPADYRHLDNGRRAMCAGNLLRGAARKDSAVVDVLAQVIAEGYKEVAPKVKKSRKPKAAPAPQMDETHNAMHAMVRGKKHKDSEDELIKEARLLAEDIAAQSDAEAWDQMVDQKMTKVPAKVEPSAPEVSWAGKNPRFKFAVVKASGEVVFKYTRPADVAAGDVVIERQAA